MQSQASKEGNMAQEHVLKQRTQILHALCGRRTSEALDSVMDILLSEEHLSWEDYHAVLVKERPLYDNARHLLDLAHCKGEETCVRLLTALKQVLPEVCDDTQVQQKASQVLQCKESEDEVFDVQTDFGRFISADSEVVSKRTPSQQEGTFPEAAEVGSHHSQLQTRGSRLNGNYLSFPKEFPRYLEKLRDSVQAQSLCVGAYDGSSHVYLDHIYTEGQLELPQTFSGASECLTLEDIVGEVGMVNEKADTVLLSGDAGSGKSTLLQRMHLLWAQGAAFQNFLLLFPFSCRRLNSEQNELSVKDLLFCHCCWPDRDKEEIFQFILDNPHCILFTFDGLDELKETFSEKRRLCSPFQCAPVPILLFNLLQGCLLQGVRKIVSSRPEAVSPALKKNLFKELVLKGFSPNGIDTFVRKQHNNSPVATKILQSLKANRALLGLCHSPVLCWIVSQCHKELLKGGEECPTITHVYLTILQHFFQRQSSVESTDGLSWMLQHYATVLHLGQLAFEGVNSSVYIFSQTELNSCGVTEKDVESGFLIQSKPMSSNLNKTYEFLHVTLQCFFAAVFVVLSTNSEHCTIPRLFKTQYTKSAPLGSICFSACIPGSVTQQHIFDQDTIEAKHRHVQITAMFLCGLLSQKYRCLWLQCCSNDIIQKRVKQVTKCLSHALQKHFRSIPQPVQGENKSMHAMPDFVWLIKCVYEMQEKILAKDAMRKLDVQHLKLTYCNIGPVECTALAYVLQHLKNPVGLQLDSNSVGDVGVEQLVPCLPICQSLYLRNNNISDEGICRVIAKAIHCENFQKIALFNNKLTDACMGIFAELLKTKQNFLSLRLGNNKISAEGAMQLAEGLKQNRSLQFLGLWGNKVGDAGASALACALENSKSLVWLSLVGNDVGNAAACAFAKVIRNCTSLEELWLSENHITCTGVEFLIEALRQNPKVKSVWLLNNDLSKEDEGKMSQREPRLLF